jgi:hypothetical protein
MPGKLEVEQPRLVLIQKLIESSLATVKRNR